ncbi:UNVERIFIED_CONTAM: hypothetical protein K2H54_024191, partial [Gekko kuhli]
PALTSNLNLKDRIQAGDVDSQGSALIQSPHLVVMQGQPVTLNCFQKNTNYVSMYWYKQERKKDAPLQLVIYSVENSNKEVEKPFQDYFVSNGTKDNALSISVANARLGDSGTYYCAKQDYTVRQWKRKPHKNSSWA